MKILKSPAFFDSLGVADVIEKCCDRSYHPVFEEVENKIPSREVLLILVQEFPNKDTETANFYIERF